MKKLLLTTTLAFATMFASAQFMVMTTISKVEGTPACDILNDPLADCEVYEGDTKPTEEDSWSATDKIGIGYQVNEKLMVGATMDGEDNYELIGRYMLMESIWATCVYNYVPDSENEMSENMELGIGYSLKVWKNLYAEPNYTMPMKEDEEGNREGSFNLSLSYRL